MPWLLTPKIGLPGGCARLLFPPFVRLTKIRLSVPLTIALTTVKLSIRSDRVSSDKAINAPTSNGKLPIVSIPS